MARSRSNTIDRTGVIEIGLHSFGEVEAEDSSEIGVTLAMRQQEGKQLFLIKIRKKTANLGDNYWPR